MAAGAPRPPSIVNRPQEQFDRAAADVPSVFYPLLDRTAERRAVGVLEAAEIGVPGVAVRVEMDQRDRTVLPRHGPQEARVADHRRLSIALVLELIAIFLISIYRGYFGAPAIF